MFPLPEFRLAAQLHRSLFPSLPMVEQHCGKMTKIALRPLNRDEKGILHRKIQPQIGIVAPEFCERHRHA